MRQLAWLWTQVAGTAPGLSVITSVVIPTGYEAPPPSEIASRREKYNARMAAFSVVKRVAQNLQGEYAACAHYIMKNQFHNLPDFLRDYLTSVENDENTSSAVRDAIEAGRRDDDAEMKRTNHHVVPVFAMHFFSPKLD